MGGGRGERGSVCWDVGGWWGRRGRLLGRELSGGKAGGSEAWLLTGRCRIGMMRVLFCVVVKIDVLSRLKVDGWSLKL